MTVFANGTAAAAFLVNRPTPTASTQPAATPTRRADRSTNGIERSGLIDEPPGAYPPSRREPWQRRWKRNQKQPPGQDASGGSAARRVRGVAGAGRPFVDHAETVVPVGVSTTLSA